MNEFLHGIENASSGLGETERENASQPETVGASRQRVGKRGDRSERQSWTGVATEGLKIWSLE